MDILKNGNQTCNGTGLGLQIAPGNAAISTYLISTFQDNLTAGDVIRCCLYQTSGGPLNTGTGVAVHLTVTMP